jgi:hypothetical protein
MKFVEIASAEEQLALWKLVNDSVWAAIQKQSADDRKRKAARAAVRKPKPKTKRSGVARAPKKPITYKPPPKTKARPQHVRQQAPAPLPPSLSTSALPPISLKSGQTTGDFTASVPTAASGPVGGEA